MRTGKDFAEDTDPVLLALRGAIRRMAIKLTAKTLWQLVGFRMPDGSRETLNSEVFGGIGIYARPPAGGQPEAIVLMVGGAKSPAVVAVRDEATRAAVAGQLEADETMLFNSQVLFYLKADGTIEARSKNGEAVSLALKSDVDGVISYIQGTNADATKRLRLTVIGSVASVALDAAPASVGTTKLKGE